MCALDTRRVTAILFKYVDSQVVRQLEVTLAGVDPAKAEELAHRADAICPYSNAIRGNVAVAITVRTK
jgi:organic hydroperoxide reductase OsmC/OhrA